VLEVSQLGDQIAERISGLQPGGQVGEGGHGGCPEFGLTRPPPVDRLAGRPGLLGDRGDAHALVTVSRELPGRSLENPGVDARVPGPADAYRRLRLAVNHISTHYCIAARPEESNA
jgi:hypothetical protein